MSDWMRYALIVLGAFVVYALGFARGAYVTIRHFETEHLPASTTASDVVTTDTSVPGFTSTGSFAPDFEGALCVCGTMDDPGGPAMSPSGGTP